MVITFNALDETIDFRIVFSDKRNIFVVLFGGVGKQYVSVDLFNFVELMTDVREGALSR